MKCVEFFVGGGLQALGIKQAGIECIAAYELDKKACIAYGNNVGPVICADLNTFPIELIPKADLYVFSPPCQSFSTAGLQGGFEDSRGDLFAKSIEIIDQNKPNYFWIENVKGLLTQKHEKQFNLLINPLMEEYNIKWRVLSAWDFGVPQKRERVFIVGVKKSLNKEYRFPSPLPGDYQSKVVEDIIDRTQSFGAKTQHYDSKAHPINKLDAPSMTIKTRMNDYVYVDGKSRVFSVKEMLRLQSAPDDYDFTGVNRANQYRIIGNGVPSRLAWYMANSILELEK